jgi:hypothetical protein
MDREIGAEESCQYVNDIDFHPPEGAFDEAFGEE